MIDAYQRTIRKLRVSLTDVCNLRCQYCMPENPVFSGNKNLLSYDSLFQIVQVLVEEVGLQEVRITGGEPLLRPKVAEFVAKLKTLPLKSVGMTTNGILLRPELKNLKDAGLDNINISLDTLDPTVFRKMSRRDGLWDVIEGINLANDLDFKLKLNCVVMKKYNFEEIPELLEFAFNRGISIRFLEVMNMGVMKEQFKEQFVSRDKILSLVSKHYGYWPIVSEVDSTSQNFRTEKGSFGIIASESMPFCENCSRIRLTSTGKILGCLFREESHDVKRYLDVPNKDKMIISAVERAVADKPMVREKFTANQMYTLGG